MRTNPRTIMRNKAGLDSTPRRTRKADGNSCHAAGGRGEEKAELTAVEFNPAVLYRLMTWLSPAYPTGAFSYSSGIEWAVEVGDIGDAATLRAWLAVMIGEGFGFSDAVFFAHAYRAAAERDDNRLRAIAELAVAFAPSKERHLETTAQGLAFLDMTRAAWPACALEKLAEESGCGRFCCKQAPEFGCATRQKAFSLGISLDSRW